MEATSHALELRIVLEAAQAAVEGHMAQGHVHSHYRIHDWLILAVTTTLVLYYESEYHFHMSVQIDCVCPGTVNRLLLIMGPALLPEKAKLTHNTARCPINWTFQRVKESKCIVLRVGD